MASAERFWTRRLRWRLLGAWRWPAFAVAVAVDAVILHTLGTGVRFNIPVVSVVGNDRQWGQITVGQRAMYGKDRVVASMLGDNCRYDKIVEGMGGHGEFVTKPDEIRPAIERAFASGKPACVNVIMDQEPPGIMGGYEFM